MILGTVESVDTTNGLSIKIDGEETATDKKYTYLSSYVPAAGDRVIIEEIGGSYVVLGKVISALSNAGKVKYADTAGSATRASSATSATAATNATYASFVKNNDGSDYLIFYYSNSKLYFSYNGTAFKQISLV